MSPDSAFVDSGRDSRVVSATNRKPPFHSAGRESLTTPVLSSIIPLAIVYCSADFRTRPRSLRRGFSRARVRECVCRVKRKESG